MNVETKWIDSNPQIGKPLPPRYRFRVIGCDDWFECDNQFIFTEYYAKRFKYQIPEIESTKEVPHE